MDVIGSTVTNQRKLMCSEMNGKTVADKVKSCAMCETRTDCSSQKNRTCLLTKLGVVTDDGA